MNWRLAGAVCLLLARLAPAWSQSAWRGFDGATYALRHEAAGYRLEGANGEKIPVPTEWLEPAGAREEDDQSVVSSVAYGPEVTAFAIGGGRVGLHLASYDIQSEGSMQAAVGRDVFLILDPATGALAPGLELGISRGRGRVGGCFQAWFHHLSVGDVDCDRRLDLAVAAERIECAMGEEGPEQAVYTRGPLRWYRQRQTGWVEDEARQGWLPCAGLLELPLLGIDRTPVDFVLGLERDEAPLASGEPEPFPPR